MNKEDKELLLKDLCARLPYGVICHYNCVTSYDDMVLHKANCSGPLEGIVPMSNGDIGFMVGMDKINALQGDIKPYLRPMSSMTDEEYEELKQYVLVNNEGIPGDIPAYIDWLNKNMFDYRDLIERGLAISVTKDNNPYQQIL